MTRWTKNILTRLFRSDNTRRVIASHNSKRFRPAMITLEDRTVPAGADMFANATELIGSFDSDITSATTHAGATGETEGDFDEAGLPHASGNIDSLWWKWTAPSTGMFEVNTFGSSPDTLLAVYTGSSLSSLVSVGFNDDFDPGNGILQSQVIFINATVGVTYYIAMDGFGSETGEVHLNLGGVPTNDNFASATVVPGGTVSGSNVQSTFEVGEPTDVVSGDANTVWWAWTATTTGSATISTFGSTLDTILAVYTGTGFGDLTLEDLNDDFGGGLQSQVTIDALAGTTYYIAVDGFLHFTGKIVLTVPPAPPQSNNAPEIDDQSFPVAENSGEGTLVGTVVATDEDEDTLTYAITGGTGAGLFEINPLTGAITVAEGAGLNFEGTSSYTLTVQVTDDGDGALTDSATITISLTDVNEEPMFSPAGPFSIDENSTSGTAVGSVVATDPDNGQTLTYSIIGGNTSGAFAIDPSTGAITVLNTSALDFETTPTFILTVQVVDNGSGTLAATTTVTVHLNDVDETLTPEEQIEQLEEAIDDLVESNDLTAQQAGTLLNKLDVATIKLDQGNINAAVNNLNAFINMVNSLINSGKLSAAEGQSLIDAANALIDDLLN